LIKDYNKRQRR